MFDMRERIAKIVAPDGGIDRRALGALVFGHAADHVDALALEFGLVVRAGDIGLHLDVHLGVQGHGDLVHTDRLDRVAEDDHALVDVEALRQPLEVLAPDVAPARLCFKRAQQPDRAALEREAAQVDVGRVGAHRGRVGVG